MPAADDLDWPGSAHAPRNARASASRTHFERLEREPPPTVHVVYGWGPHWWYDPYPRVVFVHHRPIRVHRPGRVIIRDHRR